MYTYANKPNTHDNSLLLISIGLVALCSYVLWQNSQTKIFMPPSAQPQIQDIKSLSVVLAKPAPKEIQKKPTPKPVVQEKPKPIEKKPEIVKAVEPVEPIQEQIEEVSEVLEASAPVVEAKPSPVVTPTPKVTFNPQLKEEYIAGLYAILNKHKKYPRIAKRRGLEGIVQVQFILLKDGSLHAISLYESCGHAMLDKAALKLVEKVQYYKPIPDAVSLSALTLEVPIKYARN